MEINYLEDYGPSADGLSAVNIKGTQVARPKILETDPTAYGGKTKWRCRGNREESRE